MASTVSSPLRSWITALAVALALLALPASAQVKPDQSLARYAVAMVHGTSVCCAGIYLGHGKVLTASHVAGAPPLKVAFGSRQVDALVVKAGSLEAVDVTLLAVEELRLPPNIRALKPLVLCADRPVPGQSVTVVAPSGITTSIIVPPEILPPNLREELPTLIRDVYSTGNSGSGVFDTETGCLMGIMSKKIERSVWRNENGVRQEYKEGLAKYFVPAQAITNFLLGML
jgi:hypothetical protein